MRKSFYFIIWIMAIVLAIMGIIAIGFRYTFNEWIGVIAIDSSSIFYGWRFLGVGGGILAAFATSSAWQTSRKKVAKPIGGIYFFGIELLLFLIALVGATTSFFGDFSLLARLALLVTGVQAFFLATSIRVSGIPFLERFLIPFIGHILLLTGSSIIFGIVISYLPWTFVHGALLIYATGFSLLTLHIFWLGQRADTVSPPRPNTVHKNWEYLLIVTLIIGLLSVIVISVSFHTNIFFELFSNITHTQVISIVAGSAAIIGIALLSAPDWAPSQLKRLTGIGSTVTQHALITFLLLNTLVLALLLMVPEAFIWVLGFYIALLLIGVVFEYLMVFHAHQNINKYQSPPSPPELSENVPATVVVPMFNERDVFPKNLDHNLKALDEASFVLLPATKSTDGTIDLAYRYEEKYPDRVRVIEGTTGSKAGDLNQVWDDIETPFVIILDADETIDAEFVARGLEILKKSTSVGVVQGRKVEKHPNEKRLTRFISAERRHSTWIDHPYWHDKFGANHFAGSAAILRYEVPKEIDGWSKEALTEDIDFTLRIYLQTKWRIKYVPHMITRILNPKDFWGLVRQRRRWARGWVDSMIKYGVNILKAGSRLGWSRSFGLLWVLFTSVSAPLYTVFPAITLVWFLGFGSSLPFWLAVSLAILILPAKAVSIGYASLNDPENPLPRTIINILEMIAYAYLWITMNWFIQLHAIYLQLAGAPKIWEETKKASESKE
ncbi:MAG: Glycosyl transferase family 2 [Candidatus Methanohalarchaeum thermophilum]|uniref:Glycosyl transferase family 2 n=1 Tax=Methanohalarchaeum thermophilum TaxID=1903181 RepID=A0A1Q6DV06_METT1|nr:MAG: Glycosyl transferase family 2 [Candidatus Methanohalarchaeum thermophilum]